MEVDFEPGDFSFFLLQSGGSYFSTYLGCLKSGPQACLPRVSRGHQERGGDAYCQQDCRHMLFYFHDPLFFKKNCRVPHESDPGVFNFSPKSV